MLDQKTIDHLRNDVYPSGSRVVLDFTDDPYTRLKPGDEGTVDGVDSIGTVFINWDNGSGIGLVFGHDGFHRTDL